MLDPKKDIEKSAQGTLGEAISQSINNLRETIESLENVASQEGVPVDGAEAMPQEDGAMPQEGEAMPISPYEMEDMVEGQPKKEPKMTPVEGVDNEAEEIMRQLMRRKRGR